jgi:hypothetical protein
MGIVILKDAHVSARKELEAKESIKKQIQNTFKSNPLPTKEFCKKTNYWSKTLLALEGKTSPTSRLST